MTDDERTRLQQEIGGLEQKAKQLGEQEQAWRKKGQHALANNVQLAAMNISQQVDELKKRLAALDG